MRKKLDTYPGKTLNMMNGNLVLVVRLTNQQSTVQIEAVRIKFNFDNDVDYFSMQELERQ